MALRLEDLRFEVTDRFSMFLCNRKPDHSRNQDFLVPEMISEELFTSEVTALRRRLSVLPPHCFERIVQDVYDEVLFFIAIQIIFGQERLLDYSNATLFNFRSIVVKQLLHGMLLCRVFNL